MSDLGWKRCWGRISATIILIAAEAAGSALYGQWVAPDVTGRAVSWRTANTSLGAEQPERLGAAADGQGRLQLGFKHSGYTGEDPDGRFALLTITVGVDAAPLSATERQAIEARGIRFDGSVAFSGTAPVLDVSCERCKDVAKQIR